jgi:glycosyltransferase involved in cell wall biosynthesis
MSLSSSASRDARTNALDSPHAHQLRHRIVSSTPVISVITAAFNSAGHIADTLASVRAQVGIECEHVVADGGSSDATLALVSAGLRPGGQCVSGPDSGIADAMNKGIALSRGEWLLFLQSDDYLLDEHVLARASAFFRPGLDVCGFPVRFGDATTSKLTRNRGAGFWLNFKDGINHQGTFIRRSLFDRIGDYDTSFRIAMDYDFFLRAKRRGARFAFHDAPVVAMMRDTGVSSQRDWPSLARRFDEERRVHRAHSLPVLAPAYGVWWLLYPRYRKLRHAARTGTAAG